MATLSYFWKHLERYSVLDSLYCLDAESAFFSFKSFETDISIGKSEPISYAISKYQPLLIAQAIKETRNEIAAYALKE